MRLPRSASCIVPLQTHIQKCSLSFDTLLHLTTAGETNFIAWNKAYCLLPKVLVEHMFLPYGDWEFKPGSGEFRSAHMSSCIERVWIEYTVVDAELSTYPALSSVHRKMIIRRLGWPTCQVAMWTDEV